MAYGAFQKSESQRNPAVGESPENQLATRVLWAGRGLVGLQKNGFGEDPVFDCFVAEGGNTADTGIVGYVMVSRIYSSWQGKSLRIGDLYVIEDHRRKGIGTQLLRRVMKECEDQGCRRIDCSPQLVNKALISFLKKHGAKDMTSEDGWSYYQLSQENMQKLVATSIK
ncbi:hypothetical protein HPB50_000725 [Hyalomma asiaticum]|uniref:Uncharacterized protein n=1 Tax=Hyalomma asiaticum TaxID=266040 RepID=A0ACB7SRW7_HYAAI|nr:hypothetical protein HPB50_000725 [Hyalomma asiaticum]